MIKNDQSKYHLVGIKGVAMTALAVYLKQAGNTVVGSDVAEIFSTDKVLKDNGIKVKKGFNPQNISNGITTVVATGAHGGATNIEVTQAGKLNIPVFMHGVFLGKLMDLKSGIAVAGCHGKTTTSSLIAKILSSAGIDPSYLIGTAYINGLGPAGHFGSGAFLVAEADEYMTCPLTDKTPRFHYLHPEIAVITNIDFDHPDEFGNLDEVKKAFLKFTDGIKANGKLIICIDDPPLKSIINNFKVTGLITYGFSANADYRIIKTEIQNGFQNMEILVKNKIRHKLSVRIPGRHNLLNALAAAIASNQAGLGWYKIQKYLSEFRGSNRRFELVRSFKNNALYDDYAHHPNEIKATIAAAKEWFPDKKIVIIFQPHTYSRTKNLFKEFSSAFASADKVYIADIFASAREKFDGSIDSPKLVKEVNNFKNNSEYIGGPDDLFTKMDRLISGSTVIVTMGAGNLNRWHSKIIKYLSKYD